MSEVALKPWTVPFGDVDEKRPRVHRALYDRRKVGERYRIHTNGCGGVVFDLVV